MYTAIMQKNEKGFSTAEGLVGIVLSVLIGLVGWYVWSSRQATTTTAPPETSFTTKTKSQVSHKSASSTIYRNDTFGISMQIPGDWKQQNNPQSSELIADDNENNINFLVLITKDNNVALSCSNVIKDSEDLNYSHPLPGQRTTTKLSFTAISPYSATKPSDNKLCSMMITGDYATKQGDAIDGLSPKFQATLPANRIVVNVSNIDSSTNFPKLSTALGSYRYKEVIAALKSLQVK